MGPFTRDTRNSDQNNATAATVALVLAAVYEQRRERPAELLVPVSHETPCFVTEGRQFRRLPQSHKWPLSVLQMSFWVVDFPVWCLERE